MFKVDLTGKVAFITGGGGDLGGSIAKEMARCGATVAVTDLYLASAQKTVDQIIGEGGKAKAYRLDVGDFPSIYFIADQIAADFGTIDILVPAVCLKQDEYSLGNTKTYMEQSDEHGRKEIDIDLHATGFCAKAALKYMVPQKSGKIIFISSVAGLSPEPTIPTYCIAKAGVNMLGFVLARTHAKDNINVNVICPGIVDGNLWRSGLEKMEKEKGVSKDAIWQGTVNGIPLKRAQDPVDFGYLAAFLASEAPGISRVR